MTEDERRTVRAIEEMDRDERYLHGCVIRFYFFVLTFCLTYTVLCSLIGTK